MEGSQKLTEYLDRVGGSASQGSEIKDNGCNASRELLDIEDNGNYYFIRLSDQVFLYYRSAPPPPLTPTNLASM